MIDSRPITIMVNNCIGVSICDYKIDDRGKNATDDHDHNN